LFSKLDEHSFYIFGYVSTFPRQSHQNLRCGVIAAITIPISLLALSIIFALCYYRQRRLAAKNSQRFPQRVNISANGGLVKCSRESSACSHHPA
jgi:hypothetical protein